MSLILDALRKMEQDRKVRLGGSLDIRPEVLSHRGKAHPTTRNPLMIVVACLALLLVGVGTGLLLKGSKAVQAPPRAESVSRAVTAPELQPTSIQPPAPVQPAPSTALPARAEPAAPAAPVITPPSPPLQNPSIETPPTAAAEPALAISGIAWQEERGLRRAVVNGALVGEGAEVAGARVVEIGESRVRFSRSGRTFDIPFSSAFPAR
jgi:general secretion pathway protein B